MPELVKTSDGSHTLFVSKMNEHYHSIHGAVQESEHIYIKAGYDSCTSDPLHIFEAGFGTGLNALLTAVKAISDKREVYYTSIEKYPLPTEIIEALNHYEFAGPGGREIFELIHAAPWDIMSHIRDRFHLMKVHADLAVYKPQYPVDLVYFDAFAPDKQPSVWSSEIITCISSVMRSGGIFVTYSAKGEVKRKLTAAGFDVKLLPGPPGKKEIISAKKI
jgi:tRNA U34 5-methylaminomethyl-2-thiouridine-forming methyltransferase MnmC